MTPTTPRAEIEEVDRAFERNFGGRDADGIGSRYTGDGQHPPPGSDVVSGRDDGEWKPHRDIRSSNTADEG